MHQINVWFYGHVFLAKIFVVPFSWDIYLLFRHYEPLNFLVCKNLPKSVPKNSSIFTKIIWRISGFQGLNKFFEGVCVCSGEGGGGLGELKHGRFLKITLTYSRLLSLISQKFNNATHWNFAWSKAAKEHKNIILLEKSKPTNSRTQEVNDIEILTEVCSSNRKYLLKVWFQLFVPFLSAFAKEHQNIKYI